MSYISNFYPLQEEDDGSSLNSLDMERPSRFTFNGGESQEGGGSGSVSDSFHFFNAPICSSLV